MKTEPLFAGPLLTARIPPPDADFLTDLIPGSTVLLELFVPSYSKEPPTLQIKKVVHGYKDLFKDLSGTGFGQSAECNEELNIKCYSDDWGDQSDAVAMVLLSNGIEWCSGALLNNTEQDFRPLFLTAHHCIDVGELNSYPPNDEDEGDDILQDYEIARTQNWLFRFQYKMASCQGSEPRTYYTYNGCELKKYWHNTDFALVELNESPMGNEEITWLGWDRSANPPQEGIGIHHPKGDVMKIAFNGDELEEKESAGWETPGTGFWFGKVDKYYPETGEDGGVYQNGSSGSPLFNEDKRVVGQLAKGDNMCSSERRHWHGAFYLSWDDAYNDVHQLAPILDPIGSSSQTLNTIRSPNIYISGNDPLCSSGETYNIHNVPSTLNTITWSVFPENYFTNINGTGSSFTTAWEGSDNGTATITATLTSDSSSVDITKEIWVGLPDQPEWDPEELDEVQANVPNVACVKGEGDGASSYNWGIDGGYIDEGQGTECITFIPYCTWSLGLNVEGVNACGDGPTISQRADVICMHPEGTLTVMPNPSDDIVTVTVEEESQEADSSDVQIQSTQKQTYEYYLYDLNYHLLRQFNTDMQTVQIPTNDLEEGFYILHVVQGEKVY